MWGILATIVHIWLKVIQSQLKWALLRLKWLKAYKINSNCKSVHSILQIYSLHSFHQCSRRQWHSSWHWNTFPSTQSSATRRCPGWFHSADDATSSYFVSSNNQTFTDEIDHHTSTKRQYGCICFLKLEW